MMGRVTNGKKNQVFAQLIVARWTFLQIKRVGKMLVIKWKLKSFCVKTAVFASITIFLPSNTGAHRLLSNLWESAPLTVACAVGGKLVREI